MGNPRSQTIQSWIPLRILAYSSSSQSKGEDIILPFFLLQYLFLKVYIHPYEIVLWELKERIELRKIYPVIFLLFLSQLLFPTEIEKKYKLKTQVDKKNGIVWYKHKNNTGTKSRVYVYFGKKQDADQYFLRMVIAYYAPSRLIVEEYKFTIDDEEIVVKPRAPVRTIDLKANRARMDEPSDESAGICEYYDIAINQEEFELMEKLSNTKTVKLRYNGVKGFKNSKVHSSSKKAIKDVLAAFKELTGMNGKTF